jgi:hypothetical protein
MTAFFTLQPTPFPYQSSSGSFPPLRELLIPTILAREEVGNN